MNADRAPQLKAGVRLLSVSMEVLLMLRRNVFLGLVLLGIFGCAGSQFRSAPATRAEGEESPHVQALALVFQSQQAKIREIDQENWWFDTKERQWVVRRPFAPGQIDSTHMFVVSYRIDGKEVFNWSVDTRQKTVSAQKAAPL